MNKNSENQKKMQTNKWWRPTLATSSVLVILCLTLLMGLTNLTEAKKSKQHDGKIASILDEYHSTIKCVVNIAEEVLPELNDFVTCCGFWALHDFLVHRVDDECSTHNLQQVKHISGLVVPHVRDQCIGYEHGSFTCRLLVIMPITFAILFIAFIIGICVCGCVSFHKWMSVRRKYRKVNLEIAQNQKPLNNKSNLGKNIFPDDP